MISRFIGSGNEPNKNEGRKEKKVGQTKDRNKDREGKITRTQNFNVGGENNYCQRSQRVKQSNRREQWFCEQIIYYSSLKREIPNDMYKKQRMTMPWRDDFKAGPDKMVQEKMMENVFCY